MSENGFDLRKLTDEEFIEFEKKFNAEKALRGNSYWPKTSAIDYTRLYNWVGNTFSGASDDIKSNIANDLLKAILLLTDYTTLNFVDGYKKGELLLARPRRKTQLKKTEYDTYADTSTKFIDILLGGSSK